jgi:tetratricopeptide (TPR) repeat protein
MTFFYSYGGRPWASHPAAEAGGKSFQDWYAQGEAHANDEAYGKALRCFEEALLLKPGDAEALLYQGVCLIHLDKPQRALAVLDTLVAQHPSHGQGWVFRGVALHRLGRYKEAYQCYDRGTDLADP